MDLQAQLRAWFPELEPGRTVVPGVTFEGTSMELGPQLLFRTPTGPVCVEVSPRASTERFAVANETYALSYRAGTSDAQVDPILGEQLCARLLTQLCAVDPPLPQQADRVRDVQISRALHWRELGEHSHYTLTPYVGCTVGCRFCYAQSRLAPARQLAGLPLLPWGAYVDARVNLAHVLRDELASAPGGVIKFCPIVSDPYQPIERHRRITRACLKVLAERGDAFTVMVLTRTGGILDDLQLLSSLPNVIVGVSLPSADAEVLAHFEPRAASLHERLEVLDAFRDAGVETMAVAQPMLPGSAVALAEALASRVSSVSAGGLEGAFAADELFETPAFRHAAKPQWQTSQLEALRTELDARGVQTWGGELPPHLRTREPRR